MSSDTTLDPLGLGLGRAIRAARLQAGMSMRTLATRCSVSQPFLSEVERGRAMPSIATLYRISDALGVGPAKLLPASAPGDVHVIRADEGERVASSERENSATGRLVFADDERGVEVYEYITDRCADLDVWFQHPGDKVLYVVAGQMSVEFDRLPTERLGVGDCLVHAGGVAHRWAVVGDEVLRLFLVIVHPRTGG